MNSSPSTTPVAVQDLISQWDDLASSLALTLEEPDAIPGFSDSIRQYDRWMQDLLTLNEDVGLYLLFQRAAASTNQYSTSHALLCAALSHVMAAELKLEAGHRDSLACAAMTMNVAMTLLQDILAKQASSPSREQKSLIEKHPGQGKELLMQLGVSDPLWLDIVAAHHHTLTQAAPDNSDALVHHLARILKLLDRYTAMLSPRTTRGGRSVTESLRTVILASGGPHNEISRALVNTMGLCPPGTFVRLDTDEQAVVLQRQGTRNSQPVVAILTHANGERRSPPLLHRTAQGGPQIQSSLPYSAVPHRVNHAVALHLLAVSSGPSAK